MVSSMRQKPTAKNSVGGRTSFSSFRRNVARRELAIRTSCALEEDYLEQTGFLGKPSVRRRPARPAPAAASRNRRKGVSSRPVRRIVPWASRRALAHAEHRLRDLS